MKTHEHYEERASGLAGWSEEEHDSGRTEKADTLARLAQVYATLAAATREQVGS